MTGSITDRLYRLLGDVLGVDPATLNETSSPDTIEQWDSLNHLMIVSALESEFDTIIAIDDAVAMRSVALIRERLTALGHRD